MWTLLVFIAYKNALLEWWQALLVWNAITGILCVEFAFAGIPRYCNPINELDEHFPAFRRLDVKYWAKWKCYPGAATILLPRVFFNIWMQIVTAIFLMVVSIGFKFGDKPITGWRKFLIDTAYKICCTTVPLVCFARAKLIDSDFDYSEYLGSDYLKTQTLPKKASTIIANHQSWLDSPILI